MYRLRDKATYWSKIWKFFYTAPVFSAVAGGGGDAIKISRRCLIIIKIELLSYRAVKKFVTICSAISIQHRNVTDRQTDRRTDIAINIEWLTCDKILRQEKIYSAKLLYAASAWWGFTTVTDRQRLEALIKRGIRSGLCGADVTSLAELVDSADDALFQRILYNPKCHAPDCQELT